MTSSTPALPATMRAWSQRRYGPPEVVESVRLAVPQPSSGDVIVRVQAVGLNAGDVRMLRGTPAIMRLAVGFRGPRTSVQGRDVVGTVVAVGAGVTGFTVGDDVVGESSGGGLAEYVRIPAERLARRPVALDPVTAATLPLAGGTAWQALELAGRGEHVRGGRVLVIGAGGGVGTFAVRLAVLRGATVTAWAGERALGVMAGLGADAVHDYRRTSLSTLGDGAFDAIVVVAGEPPLRELRRLLAAGGTAVLVGGGETRVVLGPLPRIVGAALLSIGASRRLRPLLAVPTARITEELARLVLDGRLAPVIDTVFGFDDARAALAHVDGGRTVGKVVVSVA